MNCLYISITIILTSFAVTECHTLRSISDCENPMFPSNMRLKSWANLNRRSPITPNWIGSVNVLACPIKSQELEKELLCGMDSKYAKSQAYIYSGFVDNPFPKTPNSTYPDKFNTLINSITCIDIVVDNMLKDIDTKYLWHGKCFNSLPSASEYFAPHDASFETTNDSSTYTIRDSQSKILFQNKMPPLSDPSYITQDLPEDMYVSTNHVHIQNGFYPTPDSNGYCPTNDLHTSIMHATWKYVDKMYFLKLKNLDNVTFDTDLSVKFFGLKNGLSKQTLDEKKCASVILHNIKYMNVLRTASVAEDVSVPPTRKDKLLSDMSHFPKPFKKMSKKIKNYMKWNKDERCSKFDINNELMKFQGY